MRITQLETDEAIQVELGRRVSSLRLSSQQPSRGYGVIRSDWLATSSPATTPAPRNVVRVTVDLSRTTRNG